MKRSFHRQYDEVDQIDTSVVLTIFQVILKQYAVINPVI